MQGTSATSAKARNSAPQLAGKRPFHILIVDSESTMLEYLRGLLNDQYEVTVNSSSLDAIDQLRKGLSADLVLLDSFMQEVDGLATLAEMRALKPALPIIMLSCSGDLKHVVRAMRLGARDVLCQPLRKSDLEDAVRSCLNTLHLGVVLPSERTSEIAINDNVSFVHCSKRMHELRSQCSLVARVDLPVLILGESGTGKEVIAQYIHKMSPRGHKTFLKVNCAAMPADLLESELFGYEAGAFTGAVKAKPGKFEICNKGTLLLDEIGEMPPALQAKLLQVLQDGTFSRLGSRSTVQVDVRVIAATNIEMKLAIAEKRFREDLFYRLNGFTMSLPPLRERKEEIPILFAYFMRKMAEKYARQPLPLSADLLNACMEHDWPGNLRELENFVKRYVVLEDEGAMIRELAGGEQGTSQNSVALPSGGLKRLVRGLKDDAESIAIAQALEVAMWNRRHAAEHLQISYKALLYKIKQYNLKPSPMS